ncbi:hypothetical protein B5S33_g1568 [[Candida] boidinii]|nr:hypothetical protein B5S33_g1568 [[Candida] boidinii]
MEFDFPSVIIDSGSSTTRAGLSMDNSPSFVMPSVYSRESLNSGDYIFGDALDDTPSNEVFTIVSGGLVYNWDAMLEAWKHIYRELQVEDRADELPLVLTENSWNTKKNRQMACQLAFEEMDVPALSILKRQLCTAYGVGRANALVIDVGGDVASVTPIHNGKVLNKGVISTKFAGNFLNLYSMNFLKNKLNKSNNTELENILLPKRYQKLSSDKITESFKLYQIGKTLREFKGTILQFSPFPIHPSQTELPAHSMMPQYYSDSQNGNEKNYELPNKEIVSKIGIDMFKLAEPIFNPLEYTRHSLPDIKLPDETVGISEALINSLKRLDTSGAVYQDLLKFIVITGGSSYIPGFEQRLINDVVRFSPNFGVDTYCSPELQGRNHLSWIGANILSSSSVGDYDNIFIKKSDYEELGENCIPENLN